MHHLASRHTMLTTLVVALVLSSTVTAVRPAAVQASHSSANMNVTLSVYTCCGSLQGFNDTNPADIFSIHNIYAKLWTKLFPHLKFKETIVNDDAALETKLTLAVNAGNPPDMVFLQRGYIGFSVLRHLAQPLDKYFNQYNVSDTYFLPGMAKWAHFGGHWWAIPAVSGPLAGQLVYLPKYMNKLGYNNSNLRTFDDLYQMSTKAVRFDKSGNLTNIGYWPGISSLTFNVWQTVARGMCSVGHGLYNTANQPTATDPCNVAFLTYLKKLSDLYGGYAKLSKFLSGDPDIWNGSPKDYMATGQALISPSANAYWSITPFDGFNFGVKGGLTYQLTSLPPTLHGTMDEVGNLPSTQQEVIIPPGAQHPDAAFALTKMSSWDYGYLLGPSTNGSPVAKDQERWLRDMVTGEAAARKAAGLSGNPSATLQGLQMQPQLARASKATLPTNPVDIYYLAQLNKATVRVLYGQQTPQAALQQVQTQVLAEQQRLKSQYGSWNW
jgi:ABC-type glycerol-3-phosphate transport system substrate-binding protein